MKNNSGLPGFPLRFSRNQVIGGLLLLVVIWAVILFRMIFSRA
jgi:uncharacterized membrane protein YhdT